MIRALVGIAVLAMLVMASSACTGAAEGKEETKIRRVAFVDLGFAGPTLAVVEYGGVCFMATGSGGVTGPFPCPAAP